MTKGTLITIEGIEGAGKSTALQFIADHLKKAKKDVVLTREPGGTKIAEEIRQVLLHHASKEKMAAETELLLVFAGRAQHIKQCILPAITAGKWVVSDRFIDASYAYQGGGREMDVNPIVLLDRWIVGNGYPDLTLLLDISPEMGFARAEKRGSQKDRIEQEKMDFFVRVRNAYLARAKQDPARIRVIDASQALIAVQIQIRDVLDELITRKV